MALETLPEDVKSHLRAGMVITSIPQCVIELILNALDSKATAIAVQLNFRTFRVQVVDNGDGISKANLNLVASHYATNKCHSLNDYKRNIRYHGYRGESLAGMKEICSKLSITSRECNADETYLRIFDSKVSNIANKVKFRPSEGTTVTLENVFFNLPVRQKRINPELDFDAVKQFLDALSVIYPNVLFSLRNDATTKMLFKNTKHSTVVESVISYCPHLNKDSFVKIRFSKHKIRISGLISKEMYPNGKLQYFYINKRPIHCQQLRKLINNSFKSIHSGNTKKLDLFPIYALNIKCPYSDVDLSFENNNYTASFVQFNIIKGFIGNIMQTLRGNEKTEKAHVNSNLKSDNSCVNDSYMELCKLKGCVQSKVAKHNDVIDIKEKDPEIKLIDQSVNLEFKDKRGIANVDTSRKNIDTSCIVKTKSENQNINKDMFLKPHNKKDRRKSNNTKNEIELEQNEIDLAPAELIAATSAELINDIPQLILSNNPSKIKSGKLEIMSRFLESTKTYPKKIRDISGYDEHKLIKSPSNDLLNTTSIIHQSPTFNKKNIVLDTSSVAQFLSKSEEHSTNAKKIQTSVCNVDEKCVQTSFAVNTPLRVHSKEVGCHDETRVYNINFSQLNRLGRGKLNLNFKINKNNVNINFDVSRSKYFNDTVEKDCGNDARSENDERMAHVSISTRDNQLQRLGQSEYFTESKSDVTDLPISELIRDNVLSNSERIQRQDGSHNNSVVKDVISETVIEEVLLESAKDTTFYNVSNLQRGVQSFGDSYFFHFENKIPDDYRIWTDSSKVDFDCNSVQNRGRFKASCSKDCSPKFENISNDREVFKKSLKRRFTEPINSSGDALKDTKKRLKTFLSQDASRPVQHLESNCNLKNDSVIGSNLMNEFFETSNKQPNKKTDKEWFTQNDGQFFVHKRTGFSTYKYPAAAKFDFNLKRRNEDIPKGNSPIITRADKCLFNLSQNTKDRLNEAIVKSYQNELDTVKWGNFIKENDHKAFFTALFKSRAKNNPIKIPDISRKIIPEALVKMYNSEQCKSFVDDLFTNLDVIGQLDRKFILAFYKYNQLILVFDQHAVHERIRLEQIQTSYLNNDGTFKSTTSNATYILNFTRTEINCLAQFEGRINNVGLHFEISDCNVKVVRIPTCVFNKFVKLPRNHEKEADVILLALFEEILANLKSTLGSLQVIPKVMQNIINSEACKGAIKFGEYLNVEDCQNLLNDLGTCNFPFQCAHGRPTLIPLIELTDNYHTLLEM